MNQVSKAKEEEEQSHSGRGTSRAPGSGLPVKGRVKSADFSLCFVVSSAHAHQ